MTLVGVIEKIYEFPFPSGNMLLSAVRYTELNLLGMQCRNISCRIFYFKVALVSFHLNSQYITSCPPLYTPLFLWGFVPWAEDTDDPHDSATDSFTANSGLWLHSAEINSDKRIKDRGRLNRTFSVGAQKQPDQQLRVIRQLPDLKTSSLSLIYCPRLLPSSSFHFTPLSLSQFCLTFWVSPCFMSR